MHPRIPISKTQPETLSLPLPWRGRMRGRQSQKAKGNSAQSQGKVSKRQQKWQRMPTWPQGRVLLETTQSWLIWL